MNFVDIRAYNDSQDFPTCCGSRFREDFVGKLNKENGSIALISVGKTDIYEQIQSYRDETDLNTLIKRAENGDLSAFSSAVFGDFSEMPETYADALNVVIEAEREFYGLPADVRTKFHNDFHEYIVTAGQKEWLEKFGVKITAADDKQQPEGEVIQNEQKQ